ncbi:MAG: zinc ABC transporter substrate-binding protein [Phycisphaerae bacterium]|nr:zinc ABC transporter substrate-binding protein [Phycisphaerae bacterium]
MSKRAFILLLVSSAVLPCGCRERPAAPAAAVAATNSLLECAVRDFLGESTPVLRLAEPGMCPGHFDIRPSQVAELRRCRVLLRLEFQKSLDGKLHGAKEEGLRFAEIVIAGGLCEPESYLSACRQTADALVAVGLLERDEAERRLGAIDRRIQDAATRCRRRAEALNGTPVLASVHQAAFCRWLGLNVIGTFSGADTAGTSDVNRAIQDGEQAGVKLVIANLPEGRRVADALAERLDAKVVVFGNFPDLTNGQSSFDDLLAGNVAALAEAVGK